MSKINNMYKLIKKFKPGGVVRVEGDPYEYTKDGNTYSYRKVGSNTPWTKAVGEASKAIQDKVYGGGSNSNASTSISDMDSIMATLHPNRIIVDSSNKNSNQGTLRALSSQEVADWKAQNKKDKVLEAIGWQNKAGNPALLQGLAKTVGASALAGVVGAYAPWLAAGYSASRLPKDVNYINYAYTDGSTADKIAAPIMTGLDLAGLYGGVRGTVNQAKSAIPAGRSSNLVEQTKIYDPYTNAGSQSRGLNQVRPTNVQVQGTNVKPQGTSVVRGGTSQGKGATKVIAQRPGNVNWSGNKNGSGKLFEPTIVPQNNFWAFGMGDVQPEKEKKESPITMVPVQPQTRTEIKTPNSWGSNEFQQEFKKAREEGKESFMFKGKSYTTDLGQGNPGKRYVAYSGSNLKAGDLSNSTGNATIVPDSTTSINYYESPIAKILAGGIKGTPKTRTVPVKTLLNK